MEGGSGDRREEEARRGRKSRIEREEEGYFEGRRDILRGIIGKDVKKRQFEGVKTDACHLGMKECCEGGGEW